MADLSNTTTLVNGDVFDPQVVSDMINAKVEKKAVMSGYTKVDNTLQGQAGSTVTVPRWGYIGEAKDYKEGEPIDTTKMAFTTAEYGIKKIGKGVRLTDEAQLSGYGNPMGTATQQIAMSISEKLDNDRVACMYESHNICDETTGVLSYDAIVNAVDMFNEEEDSAKVILIHSNQKTQLRKDPRKGYWVFVDTGGQPKAPKGGKTYTLKEAKKIVAMMREKGLNAYYTNGKKANRPLFRAFESNKGKIQSVAEKYFGGI